MASTHDKAIRKFIKQNSNLFWYTSTDKPENISVEFLVETILNYGDEKSVKKLFNLVGIKKVAEIFHKQTNRSRINYFERTAHFFELYFRRHVQGYPFKGTA